MKLQKLLKKLALPVFALAVVGMLAACSSPSGGGSGSGSGTGGNNLPALDADTEYTISFADSITDDDEAFLSAKDIKAGDKVTGAEVEASKAELTAAGYVYEINGTMLILKKKPASSSDSNKPDGKDNNKPKDDAGGTTYTLSQMGQNLTINAKPDGTYTASMNVDTLTIVVEEGTYVLKGNKVITTATKVMSKSGLTLETVPEDKRYSLTYIIGTGNTLTMDMSEFGLDSQDDTTTTTDIPTIPSDSSTPSGSSGTNTENQQSTTSEATYKLYEMYHTITIKTKADGSYVAHVIINNVAYPEESGNYVIKGNKITLTATKRAGSEIGLEEIPAESQESISYVIGEDNVLEKDNGSSSSSSQSSTITQTGNATAENISGKYDGAVSNLTKTLTLYTSVEISGDSYSVKMWTDSSKTGNPFKSASGQITSKQTLTNGLFFSGTGNEHYFTATPVKTDEWDVSITLTDDGSVFKGTISKK